MEIRPARPEEYAVVGAITVAAYQPFLTGPEDFYAARLRDAATRAAEAELWVAVDERVLGTVTWCPDGSPWHEIGRPGEGEFRMLAVDPAAQGRGVGAALVRACLERSRGEGHHGMVLSSLAEMTSAHRVYRRFGFERAPARDWSPVPGVDLIAFVLSY